MVVSAHKKFYTEEEFNTRIETSITLPRELLREYKDKYGVDTFIETGAYRGDAIHMAVALGFRDIRSVDIDPDLYNLVRERFENIPHVYVWLGDSVAMLPDMVRNIGCRCIFWLDAHTNATPLMQELEIISRMERKDHVIMIDDMRCLVGWMGTEAGNLPEQIHAINPSYTISYRDSSMYHDDILVAYV